MDIQSIPRRCQADAAIARATVHFSEGIFSQRVVDFFRPGQFALAGTLTASVRVDIVFRTFNGSSSLSIVAVHREAHEVHPRTNGVRQLTLQVAIRQGHAMNRRHEASCAYDANVSRRVFFSAGAGVCPRADTALPFLRAGASPVGPSGGVEEVHPRTALIRREAPRRACADGDACARI